MKTIKLFKKAQKKRAEFLQPYEDGSIKEAGYEFANAVTDNYAQVWWDLLCERIRTDERKLMYQAKNTLPNIW